MKKSPAAIKLAALALAIAPFAASAADLDYTYVQGGYIGSNWTSGLGVDGSYAINRDFQVIANYSHQDIDDEWGGGRLNNWGIGAGYRHELSRNWDLGVKASYTKYDANGYDGSGVDVKVGVRGSLSPQFEVFGYVGDATRPVVRRGDFDHDTYLQAGVQYAFTRNWAVNAAYTGYGDNYNPFQVNVRYSF